MHKLIQKWLDAEHEAIAANDRADRALEKAEQAKPPKNLRPATAKDMMPGAIIWYPKEDGESYWKRIEDVMRPNDEWKAYTAHDGCRYGLDGAFVEVET